MAETFTWRVETASSGETTFNVSSAKFGDGYSQEVPQGINNIMRSWNITVSGYEAQIAPIIAFLEAHAGATRFLWKPPMRPLGYYTCKRFRETPNGGGHFTLTAEFELAHLPNDPTP